MKLWPFPKKAEVRRALDPDTGLPIPMKRDRQWLQGKLTYLSLVVSALGAVGKLFGWELPTNEAQDMLTWLGANWDDLAQFVGLAGAAYGKLRAEKRRRAEITQTER